MYSNIMKQAKNSHNGEVSRGSFDHPGLQQLLMPMPQIREKPSNSNRGPHAKLISMIDGQKTGARTERDCRMFRKKTNVSQPLKADVNNQFLSKTLAAFHVISTMALNKPLDSEIRKKSTVSNFQQNLKSFRLQFGLKPTLNIKMKKHQRVTSMSDHYSSYTGWQKGGQQKYARQPSDMSDSAPEPSRILSNTAKDLGQVKVASIKEVPSTLNTLIGGSHNSLFLIFRKFI
jgi:hypothetical protein